MGDSAVIVGFITTIATGCFGLVSVFMTQRGQRETERLKAQAPRWDSFAERMQEWTESRIADLQQDIDRLREEVDHLNAVLERVQSKYEVSLRHIRELRLKSPRAAEKVPMPRVLMHDMAVMVVEGEDS